MTDQVWLWVGFNVFVLGMLALDPGVFRRQARGPLQRRPPGAVGVPAVGLKCWLQPNSFGALVLPRRRRCLLEWKLVCILAAIHALD